MPNNVYNRLTFRSAKDMARAKMLFEGKDIFDDDDREFTFNALVTMPEDIYRGELDLRDARDPRCWYEWCVTHWGTKWDAYEVKVGARSVDFVTAWVPPGPWLRVLAERLGQMGIPCMHRFADECNETNGRTLLTNGKVLPYTEDRAFLATARR